MSWLRLSSLRSRFLLFVLVVVVPILLFALDHLRREYRCEIGEAEARAATTARIISIEERRLIGQVRQVLVSLANSREVRTFDSEYCGILLRMIREHYPRYSNLGLADARGNVIGSAIPLSAPVNIRDREYFRRALENRDFAVGEFQVGRITGRPSVNFGYPVLDDRERVAGVVYAALALDSLGALEAQLQSELPPGTSLAKVDEQGTVLASEPPAGEVGRILPDLPLLEQLLRKGQGSLIARGRDGTRYLYAVARVPQLLREGSIYTVLSIPVNIAFADANATLRHELTILLTVLVFMVVGLWMAGTVLVLRPVGGLLAATRRLTQGELGAGIGPPYRAGELGELERAFDEMAATLQTRQTERDRATQALARSEADHRALVSNAPLGIFRSTRDGRLLFVNPRLVEMLGYESQPDLLRVILPTDIFVDPQDLHEALARFQASSLATGIEVRWKRKDGKQILVRVSGTVVRDGPEVPECLEVFVEDETEHRSLEAQLRHAQRMEEIGRLAGGIAHDFNNLLTAILGYGQLLADRMEADDTRKAMLEQIQSAGQRASSLTRQLLAFSRKQVLDPQVLDLGSIVTGVEEMLRRLIREDIELRTRLEERLGRVRMDAGQLEQVIVNLVVNARDAMPQGGMLAIETTNVELREPVAHEGTAMPAGSYVVLSVSDTGHGMDAATRAHIFEPFFTTKEQGKGTGLGLATVYGIVKQSDGHIWVYSQPGKGTTFKIYLPRVDEELPELGPPAEVQTTARGTESVLVVDDEAPLLRLAGEFLRAGGYTVLEASDPGMAVTIAAGRKSPIDLLVTDVVMPGLSGPQLARQLLSSHPRIKVLYLSGHSDEVITERGILPAGVSFLPKPYTRASLLHKVREVLGG